MRDRFEDLVARVAEAEPVKVQVATAFVFLTLLVITGTAFYSSMEGWTLLDGLYMTFITLTTIGFGEVHSLTPAARIFTILLAVTGVVAIGFIVTRTTQLFVLGESLKEQHLKRMRERLENHFVICGYGRLGQRIARDLKEAGKSFLVIEKAESKIERLKDSDILYLEGNAEDEHVLREAGVERAAGLITTLTDDSDNVFVTLLAREISPNLFILARTNSSDNARRLYRAGANKVISPYEIGADRMARVILRPHVDRFLERALNVGGLDLQIEELPVGEDSPLDGNTLVGADFRNNYGTIVVGIVRGDSGEVMFNPKADSVINAGDYLIVIGDREMIRRLDADCASDE